MNRGRMVAFLSALFFVQSGFTGGTGYSRADCIVKVAFLEVPREELFIDETGSAIMDLIWSRDLPRGTLWIVSGESIFFQLSDDCEQRHEAVRRIVEQLKERVRGFPKSEVIRKRFQPDPSGIDATGPSWID